MGAPGTAVAGRLDVRADRLQVPARRPEQAAGRPAVEIAHLRKTYGQLTAVDDVSFSVTEGEIFGLLGPNGAGKTTTVECAIGLRSPDSGTIRLLGLDPQADWDEVHEIVGAQLQASTFPSKLKVGEILDMYRSFYREPTDVGELTEALGLAGKRNDYYKSLSGGQRQRLSVALALIGRPKVAVLDEMTTGLDPQARRDAWGLIEGVRGRGVTVILVTHFMEEAERLCDRVALIDNGRVVALDTPARLAAQARGGKSVRFLPSAPFDDRLLTALPEVTRVDQRPGGSPTYPSAAQRFSRPGSPGASRCHVPRSGSYSSRSNTSMLSPSRMSEYGLAPLPRTWPWLCTSWGGTSVATSPRRRARSSARLSSARPFS
jgi:ABC-2 type transport system ATP-binding protein